MSHPPSAPLVAKQQVKAIAKRLLQTHVPVGGPSRAVFAALYQMHVSVRWTVGWSCRFFWYEPLFRSQCREVGDRFEMEQLPYLVGRGEICIGRNVRLSGKPSFAFSSRYSDTPRLSIGDGCFLGHNCAVTVGREVTIGKHCLIAGGVRISDFDGHPLNAIERRQGDPAPAENVAPVRLGNDVWVGHGAMVLKGVRIGDRAVIGARSVVTSDVAADTVVAGNPARVVKALNASGKKLVG